MKLLTKAIQKQLPPIYAQEAKGKEATAYVKFFTPDANFTWWATEFDPETGTFFGLVDDGRDRELTYFYLDQLQTVRGRFGLPVERDRWFAPTPLNQLK